MKKLTKFLMMIVAVFSIGLLVANAATETTITITGASSIHSYKAYQVFSGKLSRATTGTEPSVIIPDQMVDVDWGSGVNGTKILELVNAKLKDDYKKAHEGSEEGFKELKTAQDVAGYLDKEVNGRANDDEVAQWFASIVGTEGCLIEAKAASSSYATNAHTIVLPDEGYYFIKDVSNLTGKDEAYTRYLLKVFGEDTTIAVKADEATLAKRVVDGENEDSTFTAAQITDTVTFRLYANLPTERFGDYKTYKLVFHDEMSTGLTFGSYKAYVVKGNAKTEITTFVSKGGTGNEVTFTIADVKALTGVTVDKDCQILVEYTATVNENAVTGANTNTAKLEFSNDPNEATTSKLGTTVSETATVYTYALDITKIDGRNTDRKLANVKFKLCKDAAKTSCAKFVTETGNGGAVTYRFDGWTTTVADATVMSTNSDGKINVRGLDATTYYLVETETVSGYNLLKEPEAITIAFSDEDFIKSITVKNYKGSFLPSTGGIGTVIFYVCGIALIGGTVAFTVVNKKKNEEK